MNRVAVFVIYDKDGIIDDHIVYYLKQLRPFVNKLCCVVQGKLKPEYTSVLNDLCDDFFVRENTGLLTYGWIEGMRYVGWDNLVKFDELLLLNDSFFGPVFPLNDFFEACEKSNSDFYGVFKNYEDKNIHEADGRQFKHGYVRGSICYFYVIKQKLLHSSEFRKYWDRDPKINNLWDSVFFDEMDFYDFVLDSGFKIDAYQSDFLKGYFFDNLSHNMLKLVVHDHTPFIRIRSFGGDTLQQALQIGYGTDPRDTLRFIEENTQYNTDYIWKYLLRTRNLRNIYEQLQLEFVISDEVLSKYSKYNKLKIAVILHVYYLEEVNRIISYCKNFPKNTVFFVTTTSDSVRKALNEQLEKLPYKFIIKIRPNVGVAMSTLLVTFRDEWFNGNFDYVCYFHDKKSPYAMYSMQGDQFARRLYENLIGSPTIIHNILGLFEHNKHIGIIGCPEPYNGQYLHAATGGWPQNFPHVKRLLSELKVDVPCDAVHNSVAPYGDMFWFRPKALKPLFDYKFTYKFFDVPYSRDFTVMHAIERVYGFVAQSCGFVYADVISHYWARTDLVNYNFLLNTWISMCQSTISQRDAAMGQRDSAISQRDAAMGQRDSAISQRDAAMGQRDSAISQRDAAMGQRDSAISQRDAAMGQRDSAISQRDAAMGQRDSAISQRDAAMGQRDSAISQRDAAMGQRDSAISQRDAAMGQRDSAISQRDAAMGQMEHSNGILQAYSGLSNKSMLRLMKKIYIVKNILTLFTKNRHYASKIKMINDLLNLSSK